jgi:uncharacterized membrane protein YbhN (UPF0104 family)
VEANGPSISIDRRPSTSLAWWTFGVVLAAAIGAYFLFVAIDPNLHLDLKSFVVFAPIYAAAQGIERLLEPLASIYKTTDVEKKDVKEAREEKQQAATAAGIAAAADPVALTDRTGVELLMREVRSASDREKKAEAALARKQSERALIFFMIASVFSLAIAALLGLGIIQAMATEPLDTFQGGLDVVLTGLVIGAGTKPLHDLIVKLERSKDASDEATRPEAAPAATPAPVAPPA